MPEEPGFYIKCCIRKSLHHKMPIIEKFVPFSLYIVQQLNVNTKHTHTHTRTHTHTHTHTHTLMAIKTNYTNNYVKEIRISKESPMTTVNNSNF